MKKSLLSLPLALIMAACGSQAVSPSVTPTNTVEQTITQETQPAEEVKLLYNLESLDRLVEPYSYWASVKEFLPQTFNTQRVYDDAGMTVYVEGDELIFGSLDERDFSSVEYFGDPEVQAIGNLPAIPFKVEVTWEPAYYDIDDFLKNGSIEVFLTGTELGSESVPVEIEELDIDMNRAFLTTEPISMNNELDLRYQRFLSVNLSYDTGDRTIEDDIHIFLTREIMGPDGQPMFTPKSIPGYRIWKDSYFNLFEVDLDHTRMKCENLGFEWENIMNLENALDVVWTACPLKNFYLTSLCIGEETLKNEHEEQVGMWDFNGNANINAYIINSYTHEILEHITTRNVFCGDDGESCLNVYKQGPWSNGLQITEGDQGLLVEITDELHNVMAIENDRVGHKLVPEVYAVYNTPDGPRVVTRYFDEEGVAELLHRDYVSVAVGTISRFRHVRRTVEGYPYLVPISTIQVYASVNLGEPR